MIEITDQNFESILNDDSRNLILDFWALRCGPCKMLEPYLEELAREYQDDVIIGKVNVDTYTNLAAMYGVRSIPTILYLKDGEVVDKHIGATSKRVLEEKLNSLLIGS